MDSDDDYEFDVDTVVPVERDNTIEHERKRANSPSSSDNGDDYMIFPPYSLLSMQWTIGHPKCPSSAGISDGTG